MKIWLLLICIELCQKVSRFDTMFQNKIMDYEIFCIFGAISPHSCQSTCPNSKKTDAVYSCSQQSLFSQLDDHNLNDSRDKVYSNAVIHSMI